MAKIAFWITAGPDQPDKALAGIRLAQRMKDHRGQDMEVYFFGPGIKLLGDPPPPVKAALEDLFQSKAPVGICPANAEQLGIKDELAAQGYRMEPAGEALIRLVEAGYQVVGY
jgi:hypothetical protein